MRTIRTKVYKFSELSEPARQKAIERFWDINIMFEWWESTYEDAENIGLKIKEFDIDRGSYCKGEFTQDAENVANNILKEHGEKCETYKTAKNFLEQRQMVINTTPVVFDEGTDDEYEDYYDRNFQIDELEIEFLESLCEDYRIILQKDYEYLTSKEAIIETIEANEYEFTKDGEQFKN